MERGSGHEKKFPARIVGANFSKCISRGINKLAFIKKSDITRFAYGYTEDDTGLCDNSWHLSGDATKYIYIFLVAEWTASATKK